MRKTDWVEYEENGERFRIRAEYGFRYFEGQPPYWAVTGEIQRLGKWGNWGEDSCGRLDEDIAKHFPQFTPTIKWLGSFAYSDEHHSAGPSHYIANAVYWFDIAIGEREPGPYGPTREKALEHFKSTIVFGALPDDVMPALDVSGKVGFQAWLNDRLPHLMDAFKRDIDALDPSLWPTK